MSSALASASPSGHLAPQDDRHRALKALVDMGLDDLPLPAAGSTLVRWRALAEVAAFDLALVKYYEGHTDALAILAEAGLPPTRGATWGTWAAEAPGARVVARADGDAWRLHGTKAWCSGASSLDAALLTVWSPDGEGPWLAAVDLHEPGISVDETPWQAVGMSASASANVHFENVIARRVGPLSFYLERPGFWQGGCGIAACWHGAAQALAQSLKARTPSAVENDAWARQLALGALDVAMSASAALLREAAHRIDAEPRADASALALRVRASAEAAATLVLDRVGRALGATPFCRDAAFAQRAADLPVFLRQSHGDRDLVALGQRVASTEATSWPL